MTSNFVFNHFWSILKVLKILGFFFYHQKSSENLRGFEAMPTGKLDTYLVLTVARITRIGMSYCSLFMLSRHTLDLLDLKLRV